MGPRRPVRMSSLLAGKGASVATIAARESIFEAVEALRRHGIGALVVSNDGRHIDGIVSERDVVRALAERHDGVLDAPVSTIMSTTVHTCTPDDDVESLMAMMTEHRVRHVPVVLDGVLVGIVSIGDVVKSRISELEEHRDELIDYVNAR